MRRVWISASKAYPVLIGGGLLSELGREAANVKAPGKAVVVTDSQVGPLYLETVRKSLREAGFSGLAAFSLPAGEASKNGGQFLALLNFLAGHHLTRTDCLVALGGGVVGDLAGFAAACYLRGIPYLQVPTTLLAAVDASVGGKTAIDLDAGKNLAGAFWQPSLVLCDTDTLQTLPEEIFRDGCAEVIKYGILYDPALFAHLAQRGLDFRREEVIARCVERKRDAVTKDEFDRGERQLLNLGHTFGHGVEARSGFTISHGKAVAMGMAMAARVSLALGLCSRDTRDQILGVLERFGLPTALPYPPAELYPPLLSDKKRAGDTVSLILPEAIGRCVIRPTPVEDLPRILEMGS